MNNAAKILRQVEYTARSTGRDPSSVTVIAVSKNHSSQSIREVYGVGIHVFGENKIQEAEKKMVSLTDLEIEWHFLGQLQTNKVKKAVELFHMIHSVDRIKLLQTINREAQNQNKIQKILLQVNLSKEDTKAGIYLEEFDNIMQEVKKSPCIECMGLMTIPPFFENPEEVRPYFRQLRELSESYRNDFSKQPIHLSMGMSHDFQVAIQEGATFVRIGTAIFGPRNSVNT